MEWLPYRRRTGSTVTGDLRVVKGLSQPAYLPPDAPKHDLLIWLPPGYQTTARRYPVIYMHDGDNLFDIVTSYAGEWQVDETLTTLAIEGISAIVVGIPNASGYRAIEYSPYPFRDVERQIVTGHGHAYIEWLVTIVKPIIDTSLLTLSDPAHTIIAGSSMGGLISLYGMMHFPHVFGACGAFSPAYWFGDNALVRTIRARAGGAGRVYLDVGTCEGDTLTKWQILHDGLDAAYVSGVRDLRDALIRGGYRPDETLLYVEEEGGQHHEEAWRRRLPRALRFLLGVT